MAELKSYGISYATLHSYISLWSWPSHVGANTGADCFGPKKAQTSARKQVFNAQASESTSPSKLQLAIESDLSEFKRIYGEDRMVPKFHYLLHMPHFLARWKCLPNCFALERKHKEPKRYAQGIANTSRQCEASVLREVTNKHISVLCAAESKHFLSESTLINPKLAPKDLMQVLQTTMGMHLEYMVARMHGWEKCKIGDV
eukprot:4562200-Amphidinium_carterae.1